MRNTLWQLSPRHSTVTCLAFSPWPMRPSLPASSTEPWPGSPRTGSARPWPGFASKASSCPNRPARPTCTASTGTIAAEPIRALARLRETLLARIEECLESWKRPPLYAAVFGSMARATAGTTGDIDLLLVKDDDVPDELWDAQLAKLADDISKWTGNDARPVTCSASDLARRRGEPLFAEVLADGLTVCGQRSWLQRQIGQA